MDHDTIIRPIQNRKIVESRLNLPEIIDYNNEFGPELICFIPTVFWLKSAGLLEGKKVKIFPGMRSLYYFLSDHEIVYRDDTRHIHPEPYRLSYLANRQEHYATKSPLEVYPNYRNKFRNNIFVFDKPILVINNKYNREWLCSPVNYIDIPTLEVLFRGLSQSFQIVYIRQGITNVPSEFSKDENEVMQFDDLALVRRFDNILLFDDLLDGYKNDIDYNTLKLMLYANCYFYITSQGGGAHQCATFSGSLIAVVHVKGEETYFAYSNGFYTYYASPAPRILVCPSAPRLKNLVPLFSASKIINNQVHVPSIYEDLLASYAPKLLENPGAEAYRIESWHLINMGE